MNKYNLSQSIDKVFDLVYLINTFYGRIFNSNDIFNFYIKPMTMDTTQRSVYVDEIIQKSLAKIDVECVSKHCEQNFQELKPDSIYFIQKFKQCYRDSKNDKELRKTIKHMKKVIFSYFLKNDSEDDVRFTRKIISFMKEYHNHKKSRQISLGRFKKDLKQFKKMSNSELKLLYKPEVLENKDKKEEIDWSKCSTHQVAITEAWHRMNVANYHNK